MTKSSNKSTKVKSVSVEMQTKESIALAELYEARARVARAQTEIALAHFERKQCQAKMDEVSVSKKK